jgi:cysteine synthase
VITAHNILQRVGSTSLLELHTVVPRGGGRIVLKLESENPTGSMKDRMAVAMIEAAEADGRLGPGGSVVEYTGGSTGVSLALVCAAKGHPVHIVSSDAFAPEKLDHMRILGAELRLVASDSGRMTEKLTRDMIEAARVITERVGGFWTDQLRNTDQLAAYHTLAEEIIEQADGRIDAFVQGVGTAASLRGIAERLRRHAPRITIVAVEPAESAVHSGGPTGAHKIDGVGAGFDRRPVRAGLHRGSDRDGFPARTRGGAVRRHLDRRECRRRAAGRRTARPGRHGRYHHVRHRNEVPEDLWHPAAHLAQAMYFSLAGCRYRATCTRERDT